MKKITGNKSEIFVNCNQKDAADYLSEKYDLPKNYFLSFIRFIRRTGDNNGTYRIKNDYITFSLNSNQRLAYFAISKTL